MTIVQDHLAEVNQEAKFGQVVIVWSDTEEGREGARARWNVEAGAFLRDLPQGAFEPLPFEPTHYRPLNHKER